MTDSVRAEEVTFGETSPNTQVVLSGAGRYWGMKILQTGGSLTVKVFDDATTSPPASSLIDDVKLTDAAGQLRQPVKVENGIAVTGTFGNPVNRILVWFDPVSELP